MTYGVVLGITLLHVGFLLSVLAYWIASKALCPALVDWSESRYRERPMRTLVMGFLLGVPALVAGIALTKIPVPGGPQIGGGILLALLLMGLVGSAGLAQHVGRRLPAPVDGDQPWRAVLRGGGVVMLTMILPLLGWFILMPAMIASGIGATVSFLRHGRSAEATA